MLKSKTFVKKTKKGGVMKIVREHYLRDDIRCGSEACTECKHDTEDTVLQTDPGSSSDVISQSHYIVPDTNVVLHQMDVLEDKAITNVIILQTVLEEVKHRSLPCYKRLKDMLANPAKHFYTFINEHHKDTYVERVEGESSNDRNDRAIRTAVQWYQKHLNKQCNVVMLLLTDDAENKRKARLLKLETHSVKDYVESLKGCSELVDRLAQCEDDVNTSSSDKKCCYPEHLALSEIQRGIKSGRYLQGTFQASRENYLEASVFTQNDNEKDNEKNNVVFLQGRASLNRAIQDDVVAVEILPESQWSCPSSLVLEDVNDEAGSDKEDEGTTTAAYSVKSESCSVKQKTGRVVGIIRRNWRPYCGMLQPSIIKESTRHLFIAASRKIPKIKIETRQAANLQSYRIIVAIDSWPRHSRYPQGHFVKKLGEVGDKDTENEVLLLEHDVPHSNFSKSIISLLPKMPWSITEQDEKERSDLRQLAICSVDPPGCTDIDDALHCRELDNGNIEVGVHIADVGHFIRPGTALDKEAADRGTTVYLVATRIDMVPELLSSNLCSLRSNVDRFAFSVVWELNKNADVVGVKYAKSIINSKASLTYPEAQLLIDDTKKSDPVTQSLRRLNKLAKILKQRRIDKGALNLASSEIRFNVDSETHDPIDVQTSKSLETNSMVEEFMLLANITVAAKILKEFQDCALLRRHPAPPPSNFDPIVKATKTRGFTIDVNSSKALATSLDQAVIEDNPYYNTMLRIMTTRCMTQALYFCSGCLPPDDYLHYGLATEIYTHFTSPIRRYSDIIVHRLLALAIDADVSYPELLDKKKTQTLCNNLNYRHRMGQNAGRASVSLHTQIFFKNKVSEEKGYIMFVRKNALKILIPKYGLEGMLYLKEKGQASGLFTYNEEHSTQTAGAVVFRAFDEITVQISIDQSNVQHQQLCLKLVTPQVPGFSLNVMEEEHHSACPPRKKMKAH